MALPDFLIVGAMKAGTSTLQAQLAAQPGVFMTTPKEPNYFSDDDVFALGQAWYESLFDAAAPGDLTGEASTHYTKLPTYPETVRRMAAVLDAPKIIYLIRDPLERARSHYLHEWSEGVVGHDPVAAFAAHPEFEAYSLYALQIAPYLERFGAGNLLILRTETMRADPSGTLARVGAFLGRNDFRWRSEISDQNASAARSRRLPMHDLLVDHPVAAALRRTLVPKAVRTWIRTARQPKGRPELPDALVARLTEAFEADSAALRATFPELELP